MRETIVYCDVCNSKDDVLQKKVMTILENIETPTGELESVEGWDMTQRINIIELDLCHECTEKFSNQILKYDGYRYSNRGNHYYFEGAVE